MDSSDITAGNRMDSSDITASNRMDSSDITASNRMDSSDITASNRMDSNDITASNRMDSSDIAVSEHNRIETDHVTDKVCDTNDHVLEGTEENPHCEVVDDSVGGEPTVKEKDDSHLIQIKASNSEVYHICLTGFVFLISFQFWKC